MIDVHDRVPLYPGRVKMTPVSGQANVYDMVRADQPQKDGTPLHRNTFRRMQADIRTYPIATGNSVTAGDVVDVVNALAPVTKPLGEYTEGDVVQLNEGGVPVDFYVAKHDYEAALNGSGRTLLVRKLSDNNSGNDYVWNSSSFNNLSGSTIDTTLNNTYKARFDKSVQVAMATTKFYYTIGNGDASIGTLERSIFLLSNTEIGGTQESYLNIEGETLPIASVLKTSNVDNYSRSVVTTNAQSVMYFTASGGHGSLVANKARAARPCFTLPNTFLIDTGEKIQTGEKEITRSVVAEANTVVQVASKQVSGTDAPQCIKLNDNYSVIVDTFTSCYLIDNDSGEVISSTAFSSDSADAQRLIRLNDTTFIVHFMISGSGSLFRVGTLSGTTISFGSRFDAGSNCSDCILALSDAYFCALRSNGTTLYAYAFLVNGTTISNIASSTGYIGYLQSAYANYMCASVLPDDSSGNKRVCICYSKGSSSTSAGYGYARVVTFNLTDITVSFGTETAFYSLANTLYLTCCSKAEEVVVVFSLDSGERYATVITGSSTSITASGQHCQLQSSNGGNDEVSVRFVGGKVVACYGNDSAGLAVVLSKTGTTLTKNTEYTFNPHLCYGMSMAAVSDNSFIVTFGDYNNSRYVSDTILEVNGNQIAGGFTVNSTQAIALQSGEAGQNIEVIFAGTTAADFITEGQKIPSDGVYGYGPMTGWLNVIPYWAKEAGARIATGSYVGTGKCGSSNPNTLTFKFVPKLVIVTSSSGGGILVMIAGAKNAVINQFTGDSINVLLWNETRLSWYTQNITEDYQSGTQMNQSNTEYVYVAIG